MSFMGAAILFHVNKVKVIYAIRKIEEITQFTDFFVCKMLFHLLIFIHV